jgi:uncharacterized protein (TIGR04222 family)
MDPFDLPGPQFLLLYAVLVALGFLLAWLLRRSARAPADELDHDPDLHPYEVAHLAGGPTQAVNAALARLIEAGVLKLDDKGEWLSRTGTELAPFHPLEQAILHGRPGDFKVKDARAAADLEVTRIEERLQEMGLELSRANRNKAGLLPALVLAVLVLIGIGKISVGVARHKPVAFLGIDTVVIGVAALLLAVFRPHRSIRGSRYLRKLQARHAALRTSAKSAPGAVTGADLSLAVGLFGVGILAGGPLGSLHRALTPPMGSSGGCGGGCGGGGCGGGGCGGGCGGCGGG